MPLLTIFLCIAAILVLAILLLSYVCFRITFYSPPRPLIPDDTIDLPSGEIYEAFKEVMENWVKEARTMPHDEMTITSHDGLSLRGKYYEYAPGAPIELMFHGYRGTAERDLSGGVQRCFKQRRSALIVDQRGCSGSAGNILSFGINEYRDCLSWVDFMLNHFGPDVKIILTGISMGASTVLMAAGTPLPPNILGVIADCGYTTARDIIKKIIRQMKFPVELCYIFIKLGAKLYGHFNLESYSPLEAMKNCAVPVIFFHGECDDFVPCEMSKINYEACAARKRLVTIPSAGHGLSYPSAPEIYLDALKEFFGPEASF